MKKMIIGIIALILVLGMVLPGLFGCSDKKYEGLLHRLPAVEKEYTIIKDSPEKLNLCVENVSLEEFEAYRQTCIDAGYTENAETLPISYTACNSDGYLLELSVSKSILYITLTSPEK